MNFLIASHGEFATGMSKTLELFLGEGHAFHAVSAYVNGENTLQEDIENYFSSIDGNIPTIVCTDIFGGSVNTSILKYLENKNVHVIAGMNLPLLIQISTLSADDNISDRIKYIIEESKNALVYVNEMYDNELSEIDE